MFSRLKSWLGIGGGSPSAMAVSSPGASRRFVARYDNALTTDENSRNWWGADYYSAKTANNYVARRTLRIRSRYEVANNPYLFGIISANADDLIGSGPTLQLRTKSESYNDEVEKSWRAWCKEVNLVEKLRTCKIAREVDGEGFLILKTVSDLEHPVKLYPVDIEADQVTTPQPKNIMDYWVDGLELHPITGRPKSYHVLKYHPGDMYYPDYSPLKFEVVNQKNVVHWFRKFRAGQVRGVPVFSSSLDLFSELRAFRKAVLANAQNAASYAGVLETEYAGIVDDDDSQDVEMPRVNIERNTLASLPAGTKLHAYDPTQPTTTYSEFKEQCLGEACRPLSYPLNLALGTSQKFNFSSAKLDHINYRNTLNVERDQCNDTVLNHIFAQWYTEAILTGAIGAYDGFVVPPLEWHWPGYEPLDPVADAQADLMRLAGGTLSFREYYQKRGQDWEVVFKQLSIEKKKMQAFDLLFGDVVKKNVSETTTNSDANAEVANAA